VFLTRLLRDARGRAAHRLPSLCAVCRGWGAHRVCGDCVQRFALVVPRCLRCGLQVPAGVVACGACLIEPPPFTRTVAAVDYGHPWDALITQLKFHAALDLVQALADRMLDAVQANALPAPDLLVPMPLSDARLRERGYNQAWELTKRLDGRLRCGTDAHLFLRVKNTPHQLAFPPNERADNVHAAFAVEPRRTSEIRGRRIALIDDVMTTGATAAEAARTLLRAGATEVQVWVVARTPLPGAA
jgi:ComF family protein